MLSMTNIDHILVTKEKHPAINLRVYLQTANHLAQADTVNIINWQVQLEIPFYCNRIFPPYIFTENTKGKCQTFKHETWFQ